MPPRTNQTGQRFRRRDFNRTTIEPAGRENRITPKSNQKPVIIAGGVAFTRRWRIFSRGRSRRFVFGSLPFHDVKGRAGFELGHHLSVAARLNPQIGLFEQSSGRLGGRVFFGCSQFFTLGQNFLTDDVAGLNPANFGLRPFFTWHRDFDIFHSVDAQAFEDFQFIESNAEGRLVRAGDRAEYFPVYYLEPHAGNAAALGFAPGPEHPARGAPLAKARDQGQMTATARYVLVQDRASSERYSILVFAPVYHGLPMPAEVDQRRRHLRGFVLGVLRVGDMVSDALQGAEPGQLSFRLLDLTSRSEQGWLYDHPPGGAFPAATTSDLRFSRDFPLADRFWRIEVAPSAAFVARHHDQSYRWIPAGGGLLTLLAAMYLFAL
ncbi:MAG TPA: CHASE domain-containing protein, partial [Acidobacteriota bacterium]|nr:CHASE domain-containing protein [Acidobacteriota bacterium]